MIEAPSLDAGFLRNLPKPEVLFGVRRREIPTLTSKFDLLADIVETNWSELPDHIRQLALAYAYHHLEEETKPSLTERLRLAWFMFRNLTMKDEIGQLWTSIMRLTDAVFTAVERENPVYQSRLCEIVDESDGAALTADKLREWMRSV